ncbi:MAG: hypothetical protein PSX36_12870 [bacterium]|nr:hypothetical protein [bacterium]
MDKHTPYEHIRHRPCDFIVKYRFYTEDEGGRKTGTPIQGYRSDFMYAEDEVEDKQKCKMWMIHPEFLDQDNKIILDKTIRVPQTGKAKMWILNEKLQEMHKERIKVGQKGYFMEGIKSAECEVIEIVGLNLPEYSTLFTDSLAFICKIVSSHNAKYESTWLPSGCIMVDVWYKNRLFVVQLELDKGKEYFGLSEVKENEPDFTTRADKYYDTLEEFKIAFTDLFK